MPWNNRRQLVGSFRAFVRASAMEKGIGIVRARLDGFREEIYSLLVIA